MIKLELALEILHTHSKNSKRWSIEVNTTLGRRNNQSHIRIQVKTAENKENQQHRLNRCPSIRASDAWRKDRCPVGLSSLDEGRNQVKHRLNRRSEIKAPVQ